MDPAAYVKYNRVTNVLAKQFIEEIASISDWREARLKLVMDVGCGGGNASTYWIDHYFPNISKLIGVDFDFEMIDLAKQQNKKENVEFHVADIMDRASLKRWRGSVSRIFSHMVLHRCKEQEHAFRNIFDLLEPSGEAALHFIVKCPYYNSCLDLLDNPKWNRILEATNQVFPETYTKIYDAAQYRKMFEHIGFRVSVCEMKTRDFTFESDEECKNLLLSLHSIGDASFKVKEEYKNDLFEQFLKHSSRDSEGRPTYKPTVLLARLHKD